ncbi:hypothetical protein E3U55_14935 [Filobacillus milosensis]|uniref:Uncharacterized protein n=1 Tax=Filobacillus milosensis TaxID=94137 RepID=A0A4Y8IDK6_9BACI|nr:hypothetical protein [Filobacillus milosensis]TFB14072.1 hypothetical protein E3U55_14935 [Filobacillus milosensis]
MADDFKHRDVQVEHREKKTDSGRVGATAIKWIAILIIVFGIMWFLISYVFPMFGGGAQGTGGQEAQTILDLNSILKAG